VTSGEKFRKGFPKQVAKQLKHGAKAQRKLRKAELEGEFAQSEQISPARQVPSQFIWRDRKAVKYGCETAGRGIPMDSE
jgi:hypothetical protein